MEDVLGFLCEGALCCMVTLAEAEGIGLSVLLD